MIREKNAHIVFLIICGALIAGIPAVSADLPKHCEYFGKLTVYGSPAPVGTLVVAMIGGHERGRIVTTVEGQYGTSCPFGQRLSVQPAEGEYTGMGVLRVEFYVNGVKTDRDGIFSPGAMKWFDLSVRSQPPPTPTPTPTPTPDPVPAAAFSASTITGTAPLAVVFNDLSSPGPGSLVWDFGDGNYSLQQDPVHTFKFAGNYTVCLTVSNDSGTGSSSACKIITVEPPLIVPLPDTGQSPGDPDGDGFYEDMNGNGPIDFADLSLYFFYMEWIQGNESVNPFDYNQNGHIDFNDLIYIFQKL